MKTFEIRKPHEGLHTAGKGITRYKTPGWVKMAYFWSLFWISFSICLFILLFENWKWAERGSFSSLTTTAVVLGIVFIFSLIFLSRFGLISYFFNLDDSHPKTPFRGLGSFSLALKAFLASFLPPSCGLFLLYSILHSSPLTLSVKTENIAAKTTFKGSIPFYFWDYGLSLNESQLKKIDIIIPYEKGPPEKLLSKILFIDKAANRVVLELHGKRPRFYTDEIINEVFRENQKVSSLGFLKNIGAILSLQKEAGLLSLKQKDFSERPDLTLSRIRSPEGDELETIGTSFLSPDSSLGLRFFFRGQKGAVFQVACHTLGESPCPFYESLLHASFVKDSAGTLKERKAWTLERIKELLPTVMKDRSSEKETLLSLYLASLLTLDPRDPEAFFHLGKLAHNYETRSSSIRYGKDVGLAPEKLMELQSITSNGGN